MSNKQARNNLEKQYGKGCMFKKAKIEDKIEQKKTIKTYKQFKEEKRYTGKFIRLYESQMNYHHLVHKSEGGETSIENGAIVNSLAHIYMHSLPREEEEIINNELREYKRQSDECKVVFVDDLDFDFRVIPMEFKPSELDKKKGKYDRAKEMGNFKKIKKELEDR